MLRETAFNNFSDKALHYLVLAKHISGVILSRSGVVVNVLASVVGRLERRQPQSVMQC